MPSGRRPVNGALRRELLALDARGAAMSVPLAFALLMVTERAWAEEGVE
jgi:hypothetical protein